MVAVPAPKFVRTKSSDRSACSSASDRYRPSRAISPEPGRRSGFFGCRICASCLRGHRTTYRSDNACRRRDRACPLCSPANGVMWRPCRLALGRTRPAPGRRLATVATRNPNSFIRQRPNLTPLISPQTGVILARYPEPRVAGGTEGSAWRRYFQRLSTSDQSADDDGCGRRTRRQW